MTVKRIKYGRGDKADSDFEIVGIRRFFETRPKSLIEKDYRLNFWVMMYITKGRGVHSIDFTEYPYRAGDLIVIARNHIQSFRVNWETEGYIVSLNEPFFTDDGEARDMDMLAFFETPQTEPVMQVDMSEDATSRRLMELIYRESASVSGETGKRLIKSLFNSFVYSIRDENSDSISSFSTAAYRNYYEYRELVEKNFTKLKSVSDYEKIMGLSKKTLNLSCRDCAGISAKELIANRIMLEAKRLLAQNKLKNYEIAYLLGFREPSNMAGFFKRLSGISMSEFRNLKSLSDG